MDGCERGEEGAEVYLDVGDGHLAEVFAEVGVSEVGKDSNDLVGVSEGGDEWADGIASSEVVEEVEFVVDSSWAACYVDLLDGDVFGPAAREGVVFVVGEAVALAFERGGGPAGVFFLFEIPVVVVVLIVKVFCFVDGGECALFLLVYARL